MIASLGAEYEVMLVARSDGVGSGESYADDQVAVGVSLALIAGLVDEQRGHAGGAGVDAEDVRHLGAEVTGGRGRPR